MAQDSFPRWRASIRAFIQKGTWRWSLAIGFAIALGGGLWAYDVFGPTIRASWPHWKAQAAPWLRNALLWIEFLASITLTLALLSWFTAFLFCAFCAMLFSIPRLLHSLSVHFSFLRRPGHMHRIAYALVAHERLLSTLLNLLAGAGALVGLTIVLDRRLDYWDIGIQIAICAAVELIVFQVLFAEGQPGWPRRKKVS